jgi:hemoglobin-like flavoprotein
MQTELIAQSWDSLNPHHIEVIQTFYDRFFQRFPSYRTMFPESMDHQMKKMVRTMAMVARLSEDQSIIAPHLMKVGDRHSPYGLSERDLQNFKEVFIEVLAEECGGQWTENCGKAWDEAFEQVIIPIMMQGFARA